MDRPQGDTQLTGVEAARPPSSQRDLKPVFANKCIDKLSHSEVKTIKKNNLNNKLFKLCCMDNTTVQNNALDKHNAIAYCESLML